MTNINPTSKRRNHKVDPKVINLSDRTLSKTEIALLSKGLKYTPTPKAYNQELKTDVQQFTRKLRLKEYFHNKDTDSETVTENLVCNKSTFNPKKGRNQTLDGVCSILENISFSNQSQNIKTNLPKDENEALKSLMNDSNIIIKEADKGGAVVILNKNFYREKVLNMLNDNTFYKEINGNRDAKTMQKVKNITIAHFSDKITNKEKDFLTNFQYRESQFYGLPKIHKSALIKEAINKQNSEYVICPDPEDLSFRPIVGGPNAPTQRLSNLLDVLLKPICQEIDSYVKDDIDFLRHLPTTIGKK